MTTDPQRWGVPQLKIPPELNDQYQNSIQAHEIQHRINSQFTDSLKHIYSKQGDGDTKYGATNRALVHGAGLSKDEVHFLHAIMGAHNYAPHTHPKEVASMISGYLHGGPDVKNILMRHVEQKLPQETAETFDGRLKDIHKKLQNSMHMIESTGIAKSPGIAKYEKMFQPDEKHKYSPRVKI